MFTKKNSTQFLKMVSIPFWVQFHAYRLRQIYLKCLFWGKYMFDGFICNHTMQIFLKLMCWGKIFEGSEKTLRSYSTDRQTCLRLLHIWSSRKAWPLITIFANSFSFSSSLFVLGMKRKEKKIIKVVVKSHALLFDHTNAILLFVHYTVTHYTILAFLYLC